MFFATRGFAGRPAGGEDADKKASFTGSSRACTSKNTRPTCNTVGGSLGARKQVSVVAPKAGINIFKPRITDYICLKALAANADAFGGGSLASHEIQWSDASDAEDAQGGFHDGSGFASSTLDAQPRPPQGHSQRQDHRPQGSGVDRERGGEARSARLRTPAGPAAALSGSAIAAVRRRVTQGLPRIVAVAPATAPPPPPSPPLSSTTATTAADAAISGCAPAGGGRRMTANVLVMLLVAAAAVVGAGLMRAAPSAPRGAMAPPPRGTAAWQTWNDRVARGGGGGGDATAAGGGGVAGGLPYMAGWVSVLFGGTARASRVAPPPPRGSVVAAAASSRPGHGNSGNSGGALIGGASAGPRRWWFGRAGRAVAAAGAPAQLPPAPGPAPAAAAAAADGGGNAAGGGSQPPPPPPPQPRDYEWRESAAVRVITIVHGGGAASPYGTSWESLADHTAQRLEWTDPSYQMLVFEAEQLGADAGLQRSFLRALEGGAHLVVGLDVTDAAAEAFLKDPRVASKLPGVALFLGGSETLARGLTQLQGGLRPQDPGSWRTALARRLPWTPDGRGLAVWDTVQLLMGRHDSDNFLFVYLVLVNQYVTTVRQVADTTKGFDLKSLICMAKHCGSKVVGCVQDATCKSALDCLQACTFNDQVCQYRCIVSHESPLLEQFSLCILQLHNCRNLDAKPPLLPDPTPMTSFRGTPLSHETAEELFFGWLDEPGQGAPRSAVLGDRPGKPYSWLVAAGKNPAYDYFPCQHQLYYRGKGRGQVWYEPVFKAITLDGREVWRRRVYRVRRGKVPGTFHLSVLDNGVTSNEFWRVLDCEEDLQYCLFYYSGAASAAGLSYSGAVLGTPDGLMPGPQHTARLQAALRRAGIEPWELSYVDNSDCAGAPLRITGPVAAAAAA